MRSSDPSSIARDGCFRGRPCGRYGACAGQQDHIWLTLLLRMRIAIVHIGAPAGGIYPTRRSTASYCITRGHTPITVHNDPARGTGRVSKASRLLTSSRVGLRPRRVPLTRRISMKFLSHFFRQLSVRKNRAFYKRRDVSRRARQFL
jgi:hypothetical protein